MSLEESMSGNKAILDTSTGPFPFIRNSSQPNFASAISDHGGLKNALNDSMRNQEAAGLMSKGFVPNFVPRSYRYSGRGPVVDPSSGISQYSSGLGLQLADQEKRARDEFNRIINALRTGAMNAQQATDAFNTLNTQAGLSAKAQANLTRILNREVTAAQAAQAAQQPVQKTISTRFFGASRGGKIDKAFDRLNSNIGFTLAAPMIGGILESAIGAGKDRSEMGYGQRLASTGASATLTGLSTGAAIGSAIPGIGTAAGAAIGAMVGFSGAALNARTSLDDLSKSINNVINENKKDIDTAKTIGQLEKQIAGETDPFAIAVLRMKIQEAADSISNTEFAKNLLSSSKSVEEFNRTINEFTLSSGPLNQLGNLPSLIQSFAKKTKTFERRTPGMIGEIFTGDVYNIFGINNKEILKKMEKTYALAATFFDPIGIAFTKIQDEIEKTSPQAAKEFGDILNNILELKKSGALENRLKNLVDTNAISKELADQFSKFINETDNQYFDFYLRNLSVRLSTIRDNVKKGAVAQANRIADTDSLKQLFAKINDEIQNALNEAILELMNIEFKSNVGKLNIEKIGGIFDTAASAIGKNLESIAKAQFDALMVQIQLSRDAQLAELNRTQFEETRSQEMNKYLAERQSRVSAFLEKNIAPGKESRDMASQALARIGSNLEYDFKNLEQLTYNMGVDVENARKEFIRNEEFQKKSFLTQRSNAKTLFDLDQEYAKDLRDLKKKTNEEDLKLEEIKYVNLLREKQIIQSFDFANQTRQIQTQAEISRMGLGMEVNPNFFAGASRFQQEDYKFQLDAAKREKQIAAEIRTSTEQQRIVDIQRQVMSENTDATNENTKAIREYTLQMLNNRLDRLADVRKGLSSLDSSNVTTVMSKAIPAKVVKTDFQAKEYKEPLMLQNLRDPNQEKSVQQNKPSVQQNEPPSLFRQLINAWTGNERANQLPIETRSTEERMKASEDVMKRNNTSFYQIPDEDFRFYKYNYIPEQKAAIDSNLQINAQREKTQQQQKRAQLEAESKNITEQIDSLKNKRTSSRQSSIVSISPDESRIGLAKDELTRLNKQIKLNQGQLDELQAERNQTQETERQAQLDLQILDLQEKINKGKIDELNYTEQIKNIEETRKNNAEYMASRGKFSTGVAKAVGTIREETEMFKETLGTTTVNAFRDGMVNAMDAALNKADDLESALMGVAAGFLREIQGVMLRNIANQAISSFMPSFNTPATGSQRGGIIRAQKGMYISGGRTGDKNPALLEDGEYVLNRNAVKALGGPRAIDNLNFNAFPRFANGGDPGTMSASVSMNEPFERLSMYGREQSPEYQNYLERLREEEAARERKRAERKALLNQFLGTLISTGLSMGISSAIGAAKNASQAKANLKGATGSTSAGKTTAVTSFGDAKSLINSGGSVKLVDGSVLTKADFANGFSRSALNQVAATRFAASGISVKPGGIFNRSEATVSGTTYVGGGNAPINKSFGNVYQAFEYTRKMSTFKPTVQGLRGRRQQGGIIGFNQGGFLPYGSRLTDSIPAYLTGGEYVINSRAVRKYGVGGLNRINSGIARFQDGGMAGDNLSPSQNTSNTSNSNISINITVNANNGKSSDEQTDSNDNSKEGTKELSHRIKAVVLDVITSEQRTGGLLDSTKKR